MSVSDTGSTPPPPGSGNTAGQVAQFRVLAQYVKDLSFENPNAPSSLIQRPAKPDINVHVDINARRLSGEQFESEIKLAVESKLEGQIQFIVELLYAGLFLIQGIGQENLEPLLLIECPRIIFPFARRIISDVVRDGGYMPLNVEPIDFAGIYRQQLQRRAQQQEVPGGLPN